jgi:hypothetical protein
MLRGEITAFCWEPKGGHPDGFVEGGLTVCKRGRVRCESKREELNVSIESPYPTVRTSTRRAATSLMGQCTKSLRSSPLRGGKSREAGSQGPLTIVVANASRRDIGVGPWGRTGSGR